MTSTVAGENTASAEWPTSPGRNRPSNRRRRTPFTAKLDDMNAFLDIGTVVSLAVTAVFLISGALLPFVTHERKERTR